MIRFKNNGFTLIETLVALAIIGIIMTPIFVSQSSLFQTVIRRSSQIDRILQAMSFLVDARREQNKNDTRDFVLEKKIPRPATSLKYEMKPVGQDSVLGKIPNLVQERVTWQWQEGRNKHTDTLVAFVYKPKKAEAA